MILFSDLGLSDPVLQAVVKMGFEEPTPIQEKTIPFAIEGRDIIGRAQTGTGKTVAFAIPLVEGISADSNGVQALVITPTRELAVQVCEELNKIAHIKGICTLPIYGGQDIERQIRALAKKPHIVVGTPGRLMDHLRRRTLRLQNIKMLVLDEADEMLNMGFLEDIETIIAQLPVDRQTMLFSATIPVQIENLSRRFLNNPERISIQSPTLTVPTIQQSCIELNEYQKFEILCRLLDTKAPEMAIVFARTKKRVDEVAEGLVKRGYSAEAIHSDLSQPRRDTVMRHFREGLVDILVATDVAARGLDINGVTHVFNVDMPLDPESYVHRIGRTGRAGQQGEAITFVLPREMEHLRTIERLTRRKIARRPMPSLREAVRGQQRVAIEKLVGALESPDLEIFKGNAENLLAEHDSITLIAAALRLLTKSSDSEHKVSLTMESQPRRMAGKPARSRGQNSPSRGQNNQGSSGPYNQSFAPKSGRRDGQRRPAAFSGRNSSR